ncbi:MAG: rhodanese-like domain-containing protein [Cyanobacteria bacterium P01_A01_bin.114]
MNTVFGVFPKPGPLKPVSQVYDLKTRLDWGEPALTIIDIRDRTSFNSQRITGAISMPVMELVERARQAIPTQRDIYVYGTTDDEAASAVTLLKRAGYRNVAQLRGGVAAWRAVGFPVERSGRR